LEWKGLRKATQFPLFGDIDISAINAAPSVMYLTRFQIYSYMQDYWYTTTTTTTIIIFFIALGIIIIIITGFTFCLFSN